MDFNLVQRRREQRRDVSVMHMNALKHAEYIETGNVQRLTNMSKKQHLQLARDMSMGNYANEIVFPGPEPGRKIATRIHFSDGQSLVISNKPHSVLFGIIQGILVEKTKVENLLVLKSVDNWLHVCFPNTVTSTPLDTTNNEIVVTFRSVGSTPMIKNNVAQFKETATTATCEQYVIKQLGKHCEDGGLFLYVDGMFLAKRDEPLYNLTLRKKKTLTLYYSNKEAWV